MTDAPVKPDQTSRKVEDPVARPTLQFDQSVLSIVASIIVAAGVIGGVGVGACSYVQADITRLQQINAGEIDRLLMQLGREHTGIAGQLGAVQLSHQTIISEHATLRAELNAHRTTTEQMLQDIYSRLVPPADSEPLFQDNPDDNAIPFFILEVPLPTVHPSGLTDVIDKRQRTDPPAVIVR